MKRLPALVLVLLAGCGNGGQVRAPATPTPSTSVAVPAFLRVSGRPSGSLMAVVWRNGGTTITSRLSGRKVTIAGKAGRYTRGRRLVAVVKNYRDGVRLRTSHGHTLWRARTVHGRMQIRRGDTQVRYEFRRYGDDRIIVRQGTILIGSVRAVEQGAVVLDARGVRLGVSSSRPGNDMAVLLCREMAPDLRAVMAAALLRHL